MRRSARIAAGALGWVVLITADWFVAIGVLALGIIAWRWLT